MCTLCGTALTLLGVCLGALLTVMGKTFYSILINDDKISVPIQVFAECRIKHPSSDVSIK